MAVYKTKHSNISSFHQIESAITWSRYLLTLSPHNCNRFVCPYHGCKNERLSVSCGHNSGTSLKPSDHHSTIVLMVLCGAPLKPLGPLQYYCIDGFKGALIMSRDCSLSDIMLLSEWWQHVPNFVYPDLI